MRVANLQSQYAALSRRVQIAHTSRATVDAYMRELLAVIDRGIAANDEWLRYHPPRELYEAGAEELRARFERDRRAVEASQRRLRDVSSELSRIWGDWARGYIGGAVAGELIQHVLRRVGPRFLSPAVGLVMTAQDIVSFVQALYDSYVVITGH